MFASINLYGGDGSGRNGKVASLLSVAPSHLESVHLGQPLEDVVRGTLLRSLRGLLLLQGACVLQVERREPAQVSAVVTAAGLP